MSGATLLVSALLLVAQTQPADYGTVSHAIESGRLDQARSMIAALVEQGASGDPLERLLADLDEASGHCDRSLPRYLDLKKRSPADMALAERAGISALKCGRVIEASRLIDEAIAQPGASWRAWNAAGVLRDMLRDWTGADNAYERAEMLNSESAAVANNKGWSLLLRGRWSEAAVSLEKAVRLNPRSGRAAANLELARTALDGALPARRSGEDEQAWAARLNDAGVLAQFNGQRKKAIAAFAQAIEVRPEWFERASNNLQLSEAQP
ncbi:MAG: hypothetical protein ABIO43_02455 [Sphingomicrobium sp.]